jgi:acyl carrier protein
MDVQQKALEIIAKISGTDPAALRPDMDLVGDLSIDSPHALELLVELEKALGIEISDEDAARMDSVGDILGYLEALPAT